MEGLIFTDVNGSVGIGRAAGPYRIASEYRKRGRDVKVIDFCMSFTVDEIKSLVLKYKTRDTKWVGFSSTFLFPPDYLPEVIKTRAETNNVRSSQYSSIGFYPEEAEEIISFIKYQGLEIIIGGVRHKEKFDGVRYVYGPAEQQLFPNETFDFSKSQILYEDHDFIFEGEGLPIEIARGCIFKCSFCSYPLNGKKLWEFCKGPEVLREELMRNYIKFGTTEYMFADDTYNDSPEKIEELRKMYKTLPFELSFTTYARADLIFSKPETMEIMVDSGVKSMFFGIESLNHESGKAIGKGMHPDKIKEGLDWIKTQYPHIRLTISMIAGLPFDTMESLNESYEWLNNSKVDHFAFTPLYMGPGSTLGMDPEKYGYKFDQNKQWYNSNLSFQEAYNWALEKNNSRKKNKITNFTFYNRIKNLGYTEEELSQITSHNMNDTIERKKKKIEEYKKKTFEY
jgi:radical SAM superfamily enzyme YgiQ (UPF0313 family)